MRISNSFSTNLLSSMALPTQLGVIEPSLPDSVQAKIEAILVRNQAVKEANEQIKRQLIALSRSLDHLKSTNPTSPMIQESIEFLYLFRTAAVGSPYSEFGLSVDQEDLAIAFLQNGERALESMEKKLKSFEERIASVAHLNIEETRQSLVRTQNSFGGA